MAAKGIQQGNRLFIFGDWIQHNHMARVLFGATDVVEEAGFITFANKDDDGSVIVSKHGSSFSLRIGFTRQKITPNKFYFSMVNDDVVILVMLDGSEPPEGYHEFSIHEFSIHEGADYYLFPEGVGVELNDMQKNTLYQIMNM